MADLEQFDVAIVGAGIAGSAMALALSGHGLAIALIEARELKQPELPVAPGVTQFDARVSALNPKSQRLLEELDAWQAVADYRCSPYRHMTVWDADGTASIEFDCAEVGSPALGHIVENRALVAALLTRVKAARDITVLAPQRLLSCSRQADGALLLQLESELAIEAGLLVAADGAMSRVRELLGFQTREWDYGHRAIVATVQVEREHEATAWQRFLPSGPLALLPLPGEGNDHYCSIVWSLDTELADDLVAQDEADFCESLGRAFEHRLGAVLACSARFAFPLRQRHAISYTQPGVALVGDAAHTIHPLAGQGLNLGLQDVRVLAAEVLAGVARGDSPGRVELLRRYQRQRVGENLLMMAAMDGFKRLFAQRSPPLRWLRNAGMRGVARSGPIKQQLMRHAMGLGS